MAKELTVPELERMLTSHRTTLRDLEARRAKLKTELDRVDAEIKALTGTTVARRGRNKQSLRLTVLELLKNNSKGYALPDLCQTILDSGYQTTSTNFRNVLYQCLYNISGVYHDAATGTYRYRDPERRDISDFHFSS
jgi:hypothetical protein